MAKFKVAITLYFFFVDTSSLKSTWLMFTSVSILFSSSRTFFLSLAKNSYLESGTSTDKSGDKDLSRFVGSWFFIAGSRMPFHSVISVWCFLTRLGL